MLKHLDDLDKKNKSLLNLALLPGFYISDINASKKNNLENELIKIDTRIEKDKDVIEEKIFLKFFSSIDESNKKNSRKNKKTSRLSRKKKKHI